MPLEVMPCGPSVPFGGWSSLIPCRLLAFRSSSRSPREGGADSCRNVITPLSSVLSCGRSGRPGDAGKGVPVLISETASFLDDCHGNLVLVAASKCPVIASVLKTGPLREPSVPVFGGLLCHSRIWWPGLLPTCRRFGNTLRGSCLGKGSCQGAGRSRPECPSG